jgi:hypothetical protein
MRIPLRRVVLARIVVAVAALGLVGAVAGAHPAAPRAATAAHAVPALSPATFKTVSSGVAQIRTYSCNGHPLARGTGFLIGRSVAMTTRRILSGACAARVIVNGRTLVGKSWAVLSAKGVSEAATDLATIKLTANAAGAHVFTIRSSSPTGGVSLAMAGYPAGAKLVLSQGKLAWSGKKAGAPVLAVRAPVTLVADGAPLIDEAGLVAGIAQVGRGARDVPGSKRGVVEALDLARWWAPAKADLCRIYAKGGILSCASPPATPTPDLTPTPDPGGGGAPVAEPEPDPAPDPTPGPPRAPTDYVVKSCWVQFTGDNWDNVAESKAFTTVSSSDLVSRGPGNYWSVIQLTDGAPADIHGVTASLVSPTGFISPGAGFDFSQDAELAAEALDWQLSGTSLWFFQNTLYSKPQQWIIRWSFPNGQACDARFTVT